MPTTTPIGLLGGAGHRAAAELHSRLVEALLARGVREDAQLPDILVFSRALPGLSEYGYQGDPRLPLALRRALGEMRAGGVAHVLGGCNSVDRLLAEECAREGLQHTSLI